jgi:hypothetical protein
MNSRIPLQQAELFYDDRFWGQYLGSRMLSDPVVALVELVANAWDAGSRKVEVMWPIHEGDSLSVTDNGEGMTRDEFLSRWGHLSYNRLKNQGSTVTVKLDGVEQQRRVFGRNGIGRFAAFCFGSEYNVSSTKAGGTIKFRVRKGHTRPLDIEELTSEVAAHSGTTINVINVAGMHLPAETIRTELGRRFLTDPAFQVWVNSVPIAFADIKDKGLEIIIVEIPAISQTVTIKVIDAQRTDPTGRQHGVAWHVLGRLVGECGWNDPEQKSLIDGRRVEAKRFTFIVEADPLQDAGAVKSDWSGFEEENETFLTVNAAVQSAITQRLMTVTKEKRDETTANVRRALSRQMTQMTPLRREKVQNFVDKVAEECPSLSETELQSVAGVLAKMEVATTHYGLLHKLRDFTPDQIDDLHGLLEEWTIDMAKVVLDEIRNRMQLIEELRQKTATATTLEVQELQPLFLRGLWIFGPEFETIHYTANEGMTSVIQELFGRTDVKGSRNRPDFAILPDSTLGLYSYPEYDEEGGEIGPAKLVIVELKAPSVPIGDAEKAQCWKYIRELIQKGILPQRTMVQGFVLGKTVNHIDREPTKYLDDRVRITPIDFTTILLRADSRLLKLREKIRSAPFLQKAGIETFLSEPASMESSGELAISA